MRNASRMARYMMMRTGREGGERGGNYGARNTYPDMRMGDYERETEVRNGYSGYGNEGGNYARDNYGVDNRFRDRRGREHYDNGRFAPRNAYGDMGGDYRGGYNGGSGSGGYYGSENGGGRSAEMRSGGGYSEMRDAYDDEGGDTRMNVIGFDRPHEMEFNYPFIVENHGGNEMPRHSSAKMRGGAKGAEMEFTPELAKEWVKKMHNEDGTMGEHWNMDQVKKLMTQRGVEYNHAEVYAIMNAIYSDYCRVLKKYGFNSPEGYMDLALAWLKDSDAVPNKAMMYYECIVK